MTFRFAHPIALLIFLFPVVILLLQRSRGWRFELPLMCYSDVRLVQGLTDSWRVRFRRMPDVLRLAAWALLVVALARPQTGRSQEVVRGQGVDIVLALDISGSMDNLDFAPQNRLEAAKSVISDFITGRVFDRIGLVVFAEDAFHQTPPTLDYDALLRALAEVRLASDLGMGRQTAIGLGLMSSANMLRTSTAASKVIILLTDGANTTGSIDPVTAVQAVAALGIRVYTIGIGSPEFAAESGEGLDETTLETIASIANGRYFLAQNLTTLQEVYDQIDALERSDVERQVYVQWQEQAGIWLAAAFVLLLGERILRHTVFQAVP
jgi:Ca-activated chloride channel family protein